MILIDARTSCVGIPAGYMTADLVFGTISRSLVLNESRMGFAK